jgi:hypothetical protein
MAGGLQSSWPAKINGVSYEEKHGRGGETREENEEVARMCSPTADVKGGRRIFVGRRTTTEKKAGSAPLAGGASIVLQHREGAKRMQLDVVVRVVVLDCSGMTPDRRIRQPNSGGVRLWFSLCRWRMVMMLQGREGKATVQLETAAGAHGTGAHVFIGRGKGRG